jgi:hypothetical protein
MSASWEASWKTLGVCKKSPGALKAFTNDLKNFIIELL